MDNSEIDYLMRLDESGVIRHDGVNAEFNDVNEWLDTPEGSIYGKANWGHQLERYKHEPTLSPSTARLIEFSIIRKLPQDMPNIVIQSIFCEPHPKEVDRYQIRIGLPSGELTGVV